MIGKVTLREICNTLGVSRKTIQGYEKQELISPCGKNNCGHLLYEERILDRVISIRFYQKLGFSLKEISSFLDNSYSQVQEALIEKDSKVEEEINLLKQRQTAIRYLIESETEPDINYMLKIAKG